MNGRTVFAVNRSPVLAWNVEPLPYADMPAAAAAISPVVSPADPYARCWQNQVEAGSGFSYFGALYNNSLPPTAYRLQPGCMANLSQFWPPTPPPDGCGRFDGSNLYLGPHVFRHGENIPSNLRNSYQSLGHYSHVVEAPKESSQRTFKQEKQISPNVNSSGLSLSSSVSKSENLNSLCVIDSKLKPQVTMSSTLSKQEIISASSSNHEPYLCAPDSRGSSSMHPSTDKACFSPPYSLKSTLNFHTSSQDNSAAHKVKPLNGTTQENNCNASPLKNVYFSSIESENVNSIFSKKFKSSEEHYHRFEPKSVQLDVNKSKTPHSSTSNFMLHNPYASKKYEVPVSQEYCSPSSNCKIRTEKQADCVVLGEQYRQKNNVCRVKPEKSAHSDCKYQKTSVKSTSILQVPEYRTSSNVFNIPTSVMPPKLEPNDKYFLSNCSSTVPSCMTNSYANSSPYLLNKDFTPGYRSMVYSNSCSLSKPWHITELPIMSPENYFKAPEAAKPPLPGPPYASSMHEELISVAQTAPQDMDVMRMNGKLQQGSHLPKKVYREMVDDDEVQIISVQMKQTSTSKSSSRHSVELKPIQSPPVSVVAPLCLKTEKEPEKTDLECDLTLKSSIDASIENNAQWIKTEPVPPVLEKETHDGSTIPPECIAQDEASELPCISKEPPQIPCEVIAIKQEVFPEPSGTCDTSETLHPILEFQDIKKDVTSEKLELSKEINNCSNTSKMPDLQGECHDNVPTSYLNDNHNLNLLLNTIEKVTSLEKTNTMDAFVVTIKPEPAVEVESSSKPTEAYRELPKPCGLDLLSVIAGHRLVTEFDGVAEKDDIKSNYPLIKKEDIDTSGEHTKPQCDALLGSEKKSVFEMQDKLAELQKKYKQKQKELSRLKPKKRFASIYLNGKKNCGSYNDTSSASNMDSSDLNSSAYSMSADDIQILDDQVKDSNCNTSTPQVECSNGVHENKETRRKLQRKRGVEEPCSSQPTEKQMRTRSSSRYCIKPARREDNGDEHSCKTVQSSNNKGYQLRKTKEAILSNSIDDDIQILTISESLSKTKESSKKCTGESDKSTKVYSLRHSSQSSKKQENASIATEKAICLKSISSKRKSDNPKKYMPSKQGKLSETIIAKQLRNRILFDTSGSTSDDDNAKDGAVDELDDAFMKCNLGEQSRKDASGRSLTLSNGPLADINPRRLNEDNLVVKQRLLALEDGLFYAGSIKEVQASDRYGIALDGERGNRLHNFSQEELLTQTIVESKPLSSELPEGTRVCAYWSQQYRCLYPGIVGKAPCPSADWSEPRVFVLFDDGDSGQIPTKNIRLIPPDIIPTENDQDDSDSPNEPPHSSSDNNTSAQDQTPRRLRCLTSKTSPVKDCDTSNENESKDSSCVSVNDSSCDDSCFIDYSLSPSQNPESCLRTENSASCSFSNDTDATKLVKRQRKRSKRKTASRAKLKAYEEAKEKCEAKLKRHKKYKEKHRRHHNHHHHHHRHHHRHHHHHSKKHKHKKKTGKNFTSQDPDKANFIPCSTSSHKSFKSFQKDAESCTANHVEYSSTTVNLPQNENDRVC